MALRWSAQVACSVFIPHWAHFMKSECAWWSCKRQMLQILCVLVSRLAVLRTEGLSIKFEYRRPYTRRAIEEIWDALRTVGFLGRPRSLGDVGSTARFSGRFWNPGGTRGMPQHPRCWGVDFQWDAGVPSTSWHVLMEQELPRQLLQGPVCPYNALRSVARTDLFWILAKCCLWVLMSLKRCFRALQGHGGSELMLCQHMEPFCPCNS